MKFTDTRARKCDPQTSKDAAKVAAMDKSTKIRLRIRAAVRETAIYEVTHKGPIEVKGFTAKDLSRELRIPLADIYRRLPEVSGIKRHPHFRRDGCSVWVAS